MPPIPRKKTPAEVSQPTVPAALPTPSVRLAITILGGATSPENLERGLNGSNPGPTVRLATGCNASAKQGEEDRMTKATHPPDEAPNIRLAHVAGAQGDNVLIGQRGVAVLPDTSLPALLVSYYYLEQFIRNQKRYRYRDWVMDSGAFSAHNSGVEIKLQDYIDCCKRLMETDPTMVEVYALDVIGDWRGSLKNTEIMWRQGVPAIPCFHAGEPWDVLVGMARDYPKIALGGVALAKAGKKMPWAAQCFSRVWPKKIHGFAFGSEKAIMTLPFHSVDATNWEIGPCKYGQWRSFDNQRVSVRGSQQNLRVEVEWYLDLEKRARVRWKKEMEKLEEMAPTVRLVAANDSNAAGARVIAKAFGEPDTAPGQKMIKGPCITNQPPHIRLAIEARDNETRASQALTDREDS